MNTRNFFIFFFFSSMFCFSVVYAENAESNEHIQKSSGFLNTIDDGFLGIGFINNAMNLYWSVKAIHGSYHDGELLLKISHNLSEALKMSGNVGNIASYLQMPADWKKYTLLLLYNLYSARSRYQWAILNDRITSHTAPNIAARNYLAFGFHMLDSIYTLRSLWNSLQKSEALNEPVPFFRLKDAT